MMEIINVHILFEYFIILPFYSCYLQLDIVLDFITFCVSFFR